LHPEVRAALGLETVEQPPVTGEDFREYLHAERARWMHAVPLLLREQGTPDKAAS
jgi:hypothetical protein